MGLTAAVVGLLVGEDTWSLVMGLINFEDKDLLVNEKLREIVEKIWRV